MRIGIDVGILREQARGVGYYLINILERFSRFANDDEFFLYSPKPIIHKFSNINRRYNRYGTIPLPGAFWLQTQGRTYMKKDKLDVFFAPAHILPLNLPVSTRKVLAVHDLVSVLYPETMANYNRFVHNFFFKSAVRNADKIIAMSEYTKQSIINCFSIDKEKITVIYEGVSDKFRHHSDNEVTPVLTHYGLEKPYILSVGTLEPRKNYPVLLRAFKSLDIEHNLVIIGKKGWKADRIYSTIKKLGLENKVKIMGYVKSEDIPFIYNGAEIFIFPSIYEGFGLPILEALACGVPTICSNTSSLPEIGGDAVAYFDPNSVDELQLKIQQVLENDQIRKLLKEKGIIQAKKFSWDITAQKTIAVLKG